MDADKIQREPPGDVEKYDICLVFPTFANSERDYEKDDSEYLYDTTPVLSETGALALSSITTILGEKYVYSFYSFDETKVFVLLRGGLKLLKTKAESDGLLFLLNADMVTTPSASPPPPVPPAA